MSKLRVFLFLLFAAAVPNAASAAGDIYLEFPTASADGTADAPTRVDILSWSWGASNGGTAPYGGKAVGKVNVDNNNGGMKPGGNTAGKVNVQDISMTKYGRAPADGSAFTATMTYNPASPAAAERFGRTCSCPAGRSECPKGKHFDKVVIVLSDKRYLLDDVSVDCVADGKQSRREFRGHVTLMK